LLASRAGEAKIVPVFPDYEPVLQYALLALANQEQQMGIQHRQRKGVSREFHQLRDYQEGDLLNQVDWKATSRRLALVSREFREQRDQNVVFLMDAGRRMRAMDGELPQFDHCLNAVLLLCYIALRQGDNVGVSAFGGVEKWLPPVKGPRAMTTLLHHLYDYETTPHPSDFAEAAGIILSRQRKRSLVILLTNLRGEDSEDVLAAVQKRLVLEDNDLRHSAAVLREFGNLSSPFVLFVHVDGFVSLTPDTVANDTLHQWLGPLGLLD
jgi:uncharacterized protein (DUF58 family)